VTKLLLLQVELREKQSQEWLKFKNFWKQTSRWLTYMEDSQKQGKWWYQGDLHQ